MVLISNGVSLMLLDLSRCCEMKIFTPLYRKMLSWASHDKSERYLYSLAFAESIFFPIPIDVMLIPMCAVQPSRALRFGLLTTVFSVAGGMGGYLIGFFLFEYIQPQLIEYGLIDQYRLAEAEFEKWGVWVIFIAAFSPIPYKVFTIMAGALGQTFWLFMIASFFGRGIRYVSLAILLKFLGPRAMPKIEQWIEIIGWLVIATFIVILFFYYATGR